MLLKILNLNNLLLLLLFLNQFTLGCQILLLLRSNSYLLNWDLWERILVLYLLLLFGSLRLWSLLSLFLRSWLCWYWLRFNLLRLRPSGYISFWWPHSWGFSSSLARVIANCSLLVFELSSIIIRLISPAIYFRFNFPINFLELNSLSLSF